MRIWQVANGNVVRRPCSKAPSCARPDDVESRVESSSSAMSTACDVSSRYSLDWPSTPASVTASPRKCYARKLHGWLQLWHLDLLQRKRVAHRLDPEPLGSGRLQRAVRHCGERVPAVVGREEHRCALQQLTSQLSVGLIQT